MEGGRGVGVVGGEETLFRGDNDGVCWGEGVKATGVSRGERATGVWRGESELGE